MELTKPKAANDNQSPKVVPPASATTFKDTSSIYTFSQTDNQSEQLFQPGRDVDIEKEKAKIKSKRSKRGEIISKT